MNCSIKRLNVNIKDLTSYCAVQCVAFSLCHPYHTSAYNLCISTLKGTSGHIQYAETCKTVFFFFFFSSKAVYRTTLRYVTLLKL